jgi:hypothetical protein
VFVSWSELSAGAQAGDAARADPEDHAREAYEKRQAAEGTDRSGDSVGDNTT